MASGAAAARKKISEAFADLHQDLADEMHADVSDEFACLTPAPTVTTAQRAELYMRAALRSRIHVSRRSDHYIIGVPKETAEELIALALRTQR